MPRRLRPGSGFDDQQGADSLWLCWCSPELGGVGNEPGHVIREIKAAMASFEGAEVVHEGRASNIDAHTLARSSIYESEGRHVWFFDPPDGVCTSYAV